MVFVLVDFCVGFLTLGFLTGFGFIGLRLPVAGRVVGRRGQGTGNRGARFLLC